MHDSMGRLPRLLRIAFVVLITTCASAPGVRADGGATVLPARILLFNGTGTSPRDVEALQALLDDERLSYATATSSELNGMSESQLRSYGLLIIPGGDFVAMGRSLMPTATANVRNAVRSGLNYLGICAGGFLAGTFGPGYPSFNLTGVKFTFYAAERQGIRKSVVAVESPGAPVLDQYWEDGPQFSGWGTVLARYPDRTPAIVQGTLGRGRIILTGIHAEAPAEWRRGLRFRSPLAANHAYAVHLVRAALSSHEEATWLQ